MRRVGTTWLAWGTGVVSAGLALAAVLLAAANGEGPAELVFNHHAIGIVTAVGMASLGALIASRRPRQPHRLADGGVLAVPWRVQLQPAVRDPGRPGGPAGPRPGQLAGHLDQPARHHHHHHLRLPAVPRRPAAVAPLAAGGLADGRGRRGPDRRAGRAGLAGAWAGPGRPELQPPGARGGLRRRPPARPRPVGGRHGRGRRALPPLTRVERQQISGSPTAR